MSTPITLTCVCGRQLQARADAAGKRVRCPYCNRTPLVPVPTLDTLVDFDAHRPTPALNLAPSAPASPPSAFLETVPETADSSSPAPSPPPEGPVLAPPHPRRRPRNTDGARPPEYKVIGRNDDWLQGEFHPNDLEEALNSYVAQGWSLHTIFTFRHPGADRDELVVVLER